MKEWINIRDHKPKESEIVLAWLPKQKHCVCIRYYPEMDKKQWKVHIWEEKADWALTDRDAGQFMPIYEPIEHWMPLPEPPDVK